MDIYDSNLGSNTAAMEGGAFLLSGGSIVNMYNSTLASNTVIQGALRAVGGAISADSSTVGIYNSTLNSNEAEEDGGAIFADSSTVFIYNATLMKNTALRN